MIDRGVNRNHVTLRTAPRPVEGGGSVVGGSLPESNGAHRLEQKSSQVQAERAMAEDAEDVAVITMHSEASSSACACQDRSISDSCRRVDRGSGRGFFITLVRACQPRGAAAPQARGLHL